MEAPHYIEVSHAQDRTTLLTGGLPFHRRVGPALIDTLLVTRGETARRFQLGFGIDLPYPLHEALALLAAPVSIPLVDRAPSQDATGWLLHVGARNVVTTHLSSLYDGNRVVGCRVRLLETVGRGVETTLATLRPFRSAQVVDFRGRTLHECELRDGQALVRCAPFDWLEVVATW
jgi:alpha-mannosidase